MDVFFQLKKLKNIFKSSCIEMEVGKRFGIQEKIGDRINVLQILFNMFSSYN